MDKIIYFGDPLCSWCYGFGPQIRKVVKHFEKDLDFDLVMGGLRPSGTEKMGELKEMLAHHWEEVNKRSGQPFNYHILKSKEFIYDTEPPSRAVIAVKAIRPGIELDFYEEVQKLFYFENQNTSIVENYRSLVEHFEINFDDFKEKFSSQEIRDVTRESFSYSQQIGVRGFPTTVLQKDDELILLSNGYLEAEIIIDRINQLNSQN